MQFTNYKPKSAAKRPKKRVLKKEPSKGMPNSLLWLIIGSRIFFLITLNMPLLLLNIVIGYALWHLFEGD